VKALVHVITKALVRAVFPVAQFMQLQSVDTVAQFMQLQSVDTVAQFMQLQSVDTVAQFMQLQSVDTVAQLQSTYLFHAMVPEFLKVKFAHLLIHTRGYFWRSKNAPKNKT
jgi:hypothetical protein